MSRFTEQQKLMAIGGGALVVCLFAGGGVWWANGLIDEVEQSITSKRTEIAAAEQKIAKIPGAENEVIILRENLGEYVKILPEDQGLNDFVKMLNQFEQQSGIQTRSFSPGRPGRDKNVQRFERIEYVYEMHATLWQFVKFINLIENYERFVAITDFDVSQQKTSDEISAGEAIHSIKLTMETYTYNDQGSGRDAEIPDYDDKKEMLREEIFKRLQLIRMDKYEHRGSRGRRDIFVDPRESEGGVEGPPLEQQRAVFEKYLGQLQQLRELRERLKNPDNTIFDQFTIDREFKQGVDELDMAVAEVASKMQITAPNLRLRWVKEVVEPLAMLRDQGSGSNGQGITQDPYLAAEDMQALIESMERYMDEGDLEGASERFEVVSPKLLVPETDPRHSLAVTAKALHLKIKTALDFRNLDLRIQGVLVNHDGGRSGLLLNDQVYEEGEYINDELMLRRVEEEQIWFVFRGLTLIRTL